jgi:glucosamine-6-phosphate deaminase
MATGAGPTVAFLPSKLQNWQKLFLNLLINSDMLKENPQITEEQQYEKIFTEIYENSVDASKAVAEEIADLVRARKSEGKPVVLGLATGSTPTRMYDELIRIHREEGLSFENVITFNLDEYYPMNPEALQSYVRFMNENLFDHIDIKPENIHIPDGTLPREKVFDFCMNYEKKIRSLGGLDIQILGIGRTGHIGFNEPGSKKDSRTRLITLDRLTRLDAAGDFFGEENVPRRAITMGVSTILQAKRIILMAWGEAKAPIVRVAVEGEVTEQVPSSFLQNHPNSVFILDDAAASELTRFRTPWLVGPCDWTPALMRSAVVWLCKKVDKPVLKLTDEHYNEYGLGELVTEHGPAYNINIRVFNMLQHTITGWPGGKPNADDSQRPERAEPFPKRALIFSPHPDDDVISMGGTLLRLVDQGHDVHVAYQTSGNIAVYDEYALQFADFVSDFSSAYGLAKKDVMSLYESMRSHIQNKKQGDIDSVELRQLKGLIRQNEAKAAARYCKITDEHIHFMNLPFYETGRVKKKPLGEEDIQITVDLLRKIKPHQVYAAGDLADPHGTHRVCLNAVMEAMRICKDDDWAKDCYVWFYRGAWAEWDVDRADMAVPISPVELIRKRQAIFRHRSQKDGPVFQGSDSREFWERAEDRNRATAQAYDDLGLAEYEAMELFVRWHF